MTITALDSRLPENAQFDRSPQYRDGRFHNFSPVTPLPWTEQLALIPRFIFERPADAEPARAIPVQTLTRAQLLALPADRTAIVRLGHSTVLLKIDGGFWLTDPVFAERASPFSFAGPKRFHAPPISIDELPPIRGVLISHNHYDHLDASAIRQLHPKVERFYVPLGVGGDLVRFGVPAEKISEFDWWQAARAGDVTLVATPAQHFSGRGLGDRDRTLWCSWAIRTRTERIFFSGDSGYFDGFKRIGDEYGPFDLTLMETGAYDALWPGVHMQPEETLKAHLDLRGRQLLPIHNGTFSLAFHPWFEPFERISALAAEHGVALLTPEIGEVLAVGGSADTRPWWRDALIANP